MFRWNGAVHHKGAIRLSYDPAMLKLYTSHTNGEQREPLQAPHMPESPAAACAIHSATTVDTLER